MTMNRSTTMLTVAGLTVGGLVAYAMYFDYKRRTDAGFRKRLRKDKKRAEKSQTPSETPASTSEGIDADELTTALEKIRGEEVPTDHDERHQYFMTQVSMGETLSVKGPSFYMPAALCFYRAIRVYPSPLELIMVYEKSLSPPVFQLVMQLVNLDVSSAPSSSERGPYSIPDEDDEASLSSAPSESSSQEWDKVKTRAEGYYDYFPRKEMNVAVKSVEVPQIVGGQPTGSTERKKVLVCTKEFQPGDLIYKEEAIATALDPDLQGKGTHCSFCLRIIENEASIVRPDSDRFNSVYCSADCHLKAKIFSQGLLFSIEPPLPPELIPEAPSASERDAAQAAFVQFLQKTGKAAPELMARLMARQVSIETSRMLASTGSPPPVDANPVLTDGGDYAFNDHLERLRYLDTAASSEETAKLFAAVLKLAIPGLEHLATEERLSVFLGTMAYNAFGVYFGEGREDKPEPTARPEDVEKTRTPVGTQKQVGAAFYFASSYLTHSCEPSARPSFSNGDSELHLIANRALKAGDELTVAYVDVTEHEGESVQDCRRRRRMELARGWGFACPCSRCATEASPADESESQVEDKSKVFEASAQLQRT